MRYYHKCNQEGISLLANVGIDTHDQMCVSTDKSNSLFWRNICLVIDTDVKPDSYCQFDQDSRIETSYDEARISFDDQDSFFDKVTHVIVSDEIINDLENSITISEELLETLETLETEKQELEAEINRIEDLDDYEIEEIEEIEGRIEEINEEIDNIDQDELYPDNDSDNEMYLEEGILYHFPNAQFIKGSDAIKHDATWSINFLNF